MARSVSNFTLVKATAALLDAAGSSRLSEQASNCDLKPGSRA